MKCYIVILLPFFFSCVKQPEVDPDNYFCNPESIRFTSTSDCKSAPRLDSNSLYILEGPGVHDTVLIVVQGGPFVELKTETLNFYEQLFEVAYTQQPQTLQGFKQDDASITGAWEGADFDISKSAALLDQTIQEFRSQGKKIIVFGGSWGAFVTQQWLSEFENTADLVLLTVGRLNKSSGNGPSLPAMSQDAKNYLREQVNKDYTLLLNNKDLSNVIYLTAVWDHNVGPLTPAEIAWLDTNNVRHYELAGSHFVMTEAKGTLFLLDLIFRN